MVDLAQWLRAQLDADAERARTAAEEYGPDWYYDDGFVLARREDDMVATGSQDFLDRQQGEHVAEWDPARVLREIEAKRQIIDQHERYAAERRRMMGGWDPQSDDSPVLAALAAVYADRPGYREEWRP